MLAAGGARRQHALSPASARKPIALFSLCRHRTPSIEFTTGALARPRSSLRPGPARPRRSQAGAGTAGASSAGLVGGRVRHGAVPALHGGRRQGRGRDARPEIGKAVLFFPVDSDARF
ncbi:small VCP/p97-interacting protein isoform X1 [Vidua macroura]|uniref:small VCP/p97-interacting protein isoform X1 n=1 Tax=Vidua chalybeata TaxID=81927 RepID=UPI0023A7F34F|nr:small VCP/p97-interacting protein isoform X1 [Vidua chalybeata]XP_053835450.1 small VCP/p97-interacting protein isoform X1 [Vidua macroura]